MKTWKKVLIGAGISVFLLLVALILKLVFDWSWWVVGGTGIAFGSGWIVFGIVFLVLKLTKKDPEVLVTNLEDVEELIKHKMKYDQENPDNFVIEKRRLWKIGEPGSERTPIAVFIGYGSELLENRIVLVNLKNPTEMSVLIEETLEDAMKEAVKMSEHQPDIMTREILPGGIDEFGRPQPTRVIVKSQSRAEVKEKKEEEEALKKVEF